LHLTVNQGVRGSIPRWGAKNFTVMSTTFQAKALLYKAKEPVMSRILMNEIKAMLELRLSPVQIAHRLCLNEEDVKLAIETLKTY
jgi:hypothetical protein